LLLLTTISISNQYDYDFVFIIVNVDIEVKETNYSDGEAAGKAYLEQIIDDVFLPLVGI